MIERAVVYDGPCKHDGKGENKVKDYDNGTKFCPQCTASKCDGVWRVFPSEAK